MATKDEKNKSEETKKETGEDNFKKTEKFLVQMTLIILLLLGLIRIVWSDILSVKKEVWDQIEIEKVVESKSKAETETDNDDPESIETRVISPVKRNQTVSDTTVKNSNVDSTKVNTKKLRNSKKRNNGRLVSRR